MLTTRTGSCVALSCPATPDVHQQHHHQQQQQQQHQQHQVKKLFETWPVKGRKVFALEAEVRPEVACCSCGGVGGGGGGGGFERRARLLPEPMSDVCPYPLQGNLPVTSSSSSSSDSSSSSRPSSSSSSGVGESSTSTVDVVGGGVPSVCRQPQQVEPVGTVATAAAIRCCRSTMDSCYSLDLERIVNTVNRLDACGWYYGQLSWQQATDLLRSQPVGTFLLRDSSDPMFLFALSVQTERGPTSVRIHYGDGQFKLDAETTLFGAMPLFDCVVQLVDYYVQLVGQSDKSKAHVWLDDSGRRDLPVRLSRPLYCRVPRLQHLSRLAINRRVNQAAAAASSTSATSGGHHHHHQHPVRTPLQRLAATDLLPKSLLTYIGEYPYQR